MATSEDISGLLESDDPVLVRSFRGHNDAVTCVAFHTNMRQLISGGLDGNIMVWNFKPKMRALRFIGHKGAVYSVAFCPTRSLIASGAKDQTVRLWQATASVTNHAYSCTVDATVWPRDGKSSELKAHSGTVRCVRFSPDGHHLISCSDDKSVKVWTVPGQRFQSTLNGHSNWVRSCCFSPDGRLASSCGDDKTARVWDLRTKKAVKRYEGHGGSINAVQFHPDGACVAAGTTDGTIRVWDIRTDMLLQLYNEHGGAVTGIRYHPGGSFLLSASLDGTLKVWDVREGRLFYTVHGHEGSTLGVDFSPAGDFFASCGADEQVMVWKTNFDRFLDDGILIPVATNHKRREDRRVPTAAAVVKETHAPSKDKTPGTEDVAKEAETAAPTLDQILDHEAVQQDRFDGEDAPGMVAGTLKHIVGELNVMSQTLGLLVQRMTLNEDKVKKLEEQQRSCRDTNVCDDVDGEPH